MSEAEIPERIPEDNSFGPNRIFDSFDAVTTYAILVSKVRFDSIDLVAEVPP